MLDYYFFIFKKIKKIFAFQIIIFIIFLIPLMEKVYGKHLTKKYIIYAFLTIEIKMKIKKIKKKKKKKKKKLLIIIL